MTSNEIRASFLDYFARNGHRIVASSPLVPADDPTLLFTNAGMNQFKDMFLGKERATTAGRPARRSACGSAASTTTSRTSGRRLRHHTFFEMLGNFSFGDYFKEEAIRVRLGAAHRGVEAPARPAARHGVQQGEAPVVPRDDEAYAIWRRYLPAEQISELGARQLLADGRHGAVRALLGGSLLPRQRPALRRARVPRRRVRRASATSRSGTTCSWSSTARPDGTLNPLPAPSIDTGMGLERITAILQGVMSNYDTDLFTPLLSAIGDIAGTRYAAGMSPADVSMRVIADHARATTFCIADGVVPSTKGRGYELRRIMRRAMRHGKRLGISEPFFHRLVDVLVREMGDAYPELGGSPRLRASA